MQKVEEDLQKWNMGGQKIIGSEGTKNKITRICNKREE